MPDGNDKATAFDVTAQARRIALHRPRMILAILLAGLVAGCSDEPLLRDYYLGKSILQPDKMARPVERDAYGNPVLDTETEAR